GGNCVVFNRDLSPAQKRKLKKTLKAKAIKEDLLNG
ncbi:hypothetical protein LCGC14_2898320, partial [marine sediment metagenome]